MGLVDKPETVRQHYVPRFFLKGFTDEKGFFAVLHNKKLWKRSHPNNICFGKNLYETFISDESDDALFANILEEKLAVSEQLFAEKLRNQFGLIMEGLQGRRLQAAQEGDMRAVLSMFIVSLVSRMPYQIKEAKSDIPKFMEILKHNNVDNIDDYINQFHAGERAKYEDKRFRLEQLAESLAKSARVFPFLVPESMETKGKELLNSLLHSSLHIFVTCKGHPFVGCSAPVVSADEKSLWMPLSSRICVCFIDDNKYHLGIASLNNKDLRIVNKIILSVDNAEYLFCERYDYLEKYGCYGEMNKHVTYSISRKEVACLLSQCRPFHAPVSVPAAERRFGR